MNIEYLDTAISTCFSLRQIKSIELGQKKGIFSMRPQNHLMIISPFGTFKSSITKQLSAADIFTIDDFTKPSIEGSINKQKEYVPSVLENVGGKVFVIDEWNSVGQFGQNSMLALLENQRCSRTLGFKVAVPYYFKDKNGFVEAKVEKNQLSIRANFSCIAYAMEYPNYNNSQTGKALLSRFTPLFISPSLEFMEAGTLGEFDININDCTKRIDKVIVPLKVYKSFHTKYWNYVKDNKLTLMPVEDRGFLSRTLSEIIRYGVYNYLKIHKSKIKNCESIEIDNADYFDESFDFIKTLIAQFKGRTTTYLEYVKLRNENPEASISEIARWMGKSTQAILHHKNKYERAQEVK